MVAAFPLLMLLESEWGLMDSSLPSPGFSLQVRLYFSISRGVFLCWIFPGEVGTGMWINTWQCPWGVSLPELAIASWFGRSVWNTPQTQRCGEVKMDLHAFTLLQGFSSHRAQRSQQLPGRWRWSWACHPWGWLGTSVGKRWQPAALQQWVTTLLEGELAPGIVFVIIRILWKMCWDVYPSWMRNVKITSFGVRLLGPVLGLSS